MRDGVPFYASQDLPICGAMVQDARKRWVKCQRAPGDDATGRCWECSDKTASLPLPGKPIVPTLPQLDPDIERDAIVAEGCGLIK